MAALPKYLLGYSVSVMILFESVSFDNFMLLEKGEVLLDAQGLVLIEGDNQDDSGSDSNMSGKSSLFEAIVWCLFGWSLRYGRDSDAVVNRFIGKDCRVTTAFKIKGVLWKVHRFRKHAKYENHVFLERVSKNISADRDEDTQAMIEDLLGLTYEPFVHCVLFGGEHPFAELTDAEQKKILESFLGFEKIDMALQRTKREKATVVEQAEHVSRKHISSRETLAASRAEWKASQSQAATYRQNFKDRISGLEAQLEKLRKEVDGKVPFVSLDIAKEELQTALQTLEECRREAAEEQGKHSAAQEAHGAAKALVAAGKCPTCGQPTSKTTIPNLPPKVFLKEAQGKVVHAREAVTDCQLTLNDAQSFEDVQKLIIQAEDRIRQERHLVPEIDEDTPALQFCRDLLKEASLRMEHSALLRRKKELEFWEEGFGNSGIKTLIVKRSLPVLNARVAEIAARLLNGTLQFSAMKTLKSGAERSLFHVEYEAKRGANRYIGESSGGKRRVDICILLCFAGFTRVCNLLLVDELLDSLDESGREAALEILKGMRSTVMVVSHRKDVHGADQRWIVQKKNGKSKILTELPAVSPACSTEKIPQEESR